MLDEISAKVLDIATDLNSDWGLDTDDYLTTSGELGTVLSLQGEVFFRQATRAFRHFVFAFAPREYFEADAAFHPLDRFRQHDPVIWNR